jgi:hypothetical protein
MTYIVEKITVTFTMNHCLADPPSTILGGPNDLRAFVRSVIESVSDGSPIKWKTTGLFEVPEPSGGDN